MNKRLLLSFGLVAIFGTPAVYAMEHPKEHPAPSKSEKHPESAQDKKQAMKAFVEAVEERVNSESDETDGAFVVHDEKLDKEWRLKLVRIHKDKIAQVEDSLFFACADFKEVKGRNKVDLDFYANRTDSGFEVREVLIHKVNGRPRFVYDQNNRRMPAAAADQGSSGRSRDSKAVYKCPMDGYTSDKPGKCPKCGMDLQKQ